MTGGPPTQDPPTPTVSRLATVCNQKGLHARAAARFVKLAGTFEARVTVGKDGQTVSGLSILGLMMLAAGSGSTVEIGAQGADAAAAVAALCALIGAGFEDN